MHKSVNCFKYFFSLVLIVLINFQLYAQLQQDSLITTKTIKIGLKDAPPFVMQNDRGEYEGISLESWNMVNEQLQVHFEYEYYETLEGLLQAVEDGDVDMSINPVTVTKHRMQQMDFSQPYFISETTVAKKKESSIMNFLNNIISWQFFSAIALLVSVILIFGFLIWLFERKRNHEEFGGTLKGIGQGFWWSAVTMTTVGYGDKAPKTLGGRVIGFIWMFLAIILISSLTAGIASSLTVQSMHNTVKNVNDLNKFEVTTISKSSADEFLQRYRIKTTLADDPLLALESVKQGDAEVFVYDKPIISYLLEEHELAGEIELSKSPLKKDYYSYSYPQNSPLKAMIDPILIEVIKTTDWKIITDEF